MSRTHHYLKTLPQYFLLQEKGVKNFEVRRNDRGYKLGDILHLQEFVPPDTYTTRVLLREVTYVLDDLDYCKQGFVVLGTKEA